GSQAWEWKNFIKGEYGAVETHGGSLLQFVNDKGERVKLADFASTAPVAREQLERSKGTWFMNETTLPTYTVEQVQAGFKANPNLRIRTEVIHNSAAPASAATGVDMTLTKHKHKSVLTREASEAMLGNAVYVVEGANLI